VFSTGTSSAGNTGAIYVGTGAATGGRGGSVTFAVGTGTSGVGGDMNIQAGGTSATAKVGGSIYIKPGVGTTSTSAVYIYDGAGALRMTVASDTINVDSSGTVAMTASSSVAMTASTTITLSATTSISFDSVLLLGISTGTGTVSGSAVTINKMTGQITSSSTTLAAGSSESFTLTNSQITSADSIMIANVLSPCTTGWVIVTKAAVSAAGSAVITVYNVGTAACASTYVIGFLVLNST
jgi:hypothetical protein